MAIYSHYAIFALESNISHEITLGCVSILGQFGIKLRCVIVLILAQSRGSEKARFPRNEMRPQSIIALPQSMEMQVRTESEMQIHPAPYNVDTEGVDGAVVSLGAFP